MPFHISLPWGGGGGDGFPYHTRSRMSRKFSGLLVMRRGNSCYILHILVAWFTLYILARKYGRGGGGYYGHFCPFRFVAASKRSRYFRREKWGRKGWSESIFSGLFFLSSSFFQRLSEMRSQRKDICCSGRGSNCFAKSPRGQYTFFSSSSVALL